MQIYRRFRILILSDPYPVSLRLDTDTTVEGTYMRIFASGFSWGSAPVPDPVSARGSDPYPTFKINPQPWFPPKHGVVSVYFRSNCKSLLIVILIFF